MNGKAREFVTTTEKWNEEYGRERYVSGYLFVFMFGYLPSFNRFLVAGPTTPMALNPYLV